MKPVLILLATVIATACSPSDDKERWAGPPAAGRTIELTVTEDGFRPTPVSVKANEPLTLLITRTTDRTCATDVVIPDHHIEKKLPLNQTVSISFTPTRTGELVYGCSMDQMIRGVLDVR